MTQSPSPAVRSFFLQPIRPDTTPRNLRWVWAGTVERVRGGVSETLRYATLRDYSRYPGPKLREFA